MSPESAPPTVTGPVRSLAVGVAEYHRSPTRLAFYDLLWNFVATCREVARAHRVGKVHLAITPEKILLGAPGEIAVAGWEHPPAAIRPARENMILRAAPADMQELAYRAPEQVSGGGPDGSAASDIYSLGAVLYHLLTGQPPFEGHSCQELIDRICEALPWPPTAVARSVPPPLESVCLKAMDHDPARRYATADELAREIERWLAGEPVQADPEPVRSGLRRWLANHPRLVTGIAAGLLGALAAGLPLGAAVWYLDRVCREAVGANLGLQKQLQEDAGPALRQAETQRLALEQQLRQAQAQRAAAAAERHQALTTLEALAATAEPRPGDTAAVAELKKQQLRTVLDGARRLALAADQDGTADRTAVLHRVHLGQLLLVLGQGEEARRQYQRGLALAHRLAQGQTDSSLAQRDLYMAAYGVGQAQLFLRQPTAARESFRMALAAAEAAAKAEPHNLAARREAVACHEQIGLTSLRLGDVAAARDAFTQMQTAVEGYARDAGDSLPVQIYRAAAYAHRGEVERKDYRFEEAVKWFERALGVLRPLKAEGKLRDLPQQAAQLQQTERLLADCQAGLRAADDLDFALSRPSAEVPRLLVARAGVLARRGRPAEAAATAEKLRQLNPREPNNLYNVACCLALCVPPDAQTSDEKTARADLVRRALAALREAFTAGFRDVEHVETDPDLTALRSEPDYCTLLEEMKAVRAWLTFPTLP